VTLTDEELAERLEQRLMSHGIYVDDYVREDGELHIKYETAQAGDGIAKNEIGRLLNVLLDAREEGWEPVDVTAWVYAIGEEDPNGQWEAHEGWMYALEKGYLTETDFSQLVLSTVEVYAHERADDA
jgi:hypothetical protein